MQSSYRVLLTLGAAFFALGILCAEDEIPALRTNKKVFKRKKGETIETHSVETTYRGKTKIMMVMSVNGRLRSRSYMTGNTLCVEADDDGDGFIESLAIFDQSPQGFRLEMFTRGKDGSVSPVDSKHLADLLKSADKVSEFWKEFSTEVGAEKTMPRK